MFFQQLPLFQPHFNTESLVLVRVYIINKHNDETSTNTKINNNNMMKNSQIKLCAYHPPSKIKVYFVFYLHEWSINDKLLVFL